MKDNNYIVIQGWMVNKLKLSGNDLMVYAIIYGFSQDKESKYEGSGKYIADSLGISRRAVTNILNDLVKAGYLKKFERTERNLKFCDYQAAPEFFPKDSKEGDNGGMENSSIGGKNLPSEGMENSSIPRNFPPDGYGKNFHRGMENSSTHITGSNINLDTATTAEQPDLIPETPPDGETAAAEALSPEKIKKAMLELDRSLLLKADFYPRASAFMSLHYLDMGYLAWLYKQVELREPRDFDGFFFTLFFAENMIEKYKISKQPPKPPPPVFTVCPVCGASHDKQAEKCPHCSLPKDSSSGQIELYRDLISLPPDRRDEYLQKYNGIYDSCGMFDFQKREFLLNELKKDFFPEAVYEEPSRSYHP